MIEMLSGFACAGPHLLSQEAKEVRSRACAFHLFWLHCSAFCLWDQTTYAACLHVSSKLMCSWRIAVHGTVSAAAGAHVQCGVLYGRLALQSPAGELVFQPFAVAYCSTRLANRSTVLSVQE